MHWEEYSQPQRLNASQSHHETSLSCASKFVTVHGQFLAGVDTFNSIHCSRRVPNHFYTTLAVYLSHMALFCAENLGSERLESVFLLTTRTSTNVSAARSGGKYLIAPAIAALNNHF